MINNLGNKTTMSRNIKDYMARDKIDRKELSQMVSVPYTTVCDWINAKTYPRIDKIEKMALIFGIQKSDLIEEKPATIGDELSDMTLVKFPVVGSIAAGYGCCAVEEYTGEYTYFSASELSAEPEEYFVLRVKGNSMYPKLLEGDSVLVRRKPSVDSGKIAVVLYDGEEATVKKVNYVYGENWLELVPINPEYQTKRIEGADLEQCRVLGEVVKLQRDM